MMQRTVQTMINYIFFNLFCIYTPHYTFADDMKTEKNRNKIEMTSYVPLNTFRKRVSEIRTRIAFA